MMVERHRLFAALRSVTWMDVCGDGLHASIGIRVLSLRKTDGGTARPRLLRISTARKFVVAVTGGKLQTSDSGAGFAFQNN
jgi:hypothetical protein